MGPDENPDAMAEIDVALVRELIGAQFPTWAHLPIHRVELDGWDNRTFRLGSEMSVRLPSHERYASQVAKEQEWLPRLAPALPLPIPVPVALGVPNERYPWHWSVYRWLEGDNATVDRVDDLTTFAAELARFLAALQQADTTDAPPPGPHNFFRGGSVGVYADETRRAILGLAGQIDAEAVKKVWDSAMEAEWDGAPVWVHGDVSASNLLVRGGRLSAVIDFGCSAVGEPACDLTIAWTFFSGASREAFRAGLPLDPGTWARARGWALWKALIMLAAHPEEGTADSTAAKRVIDEVLLDHDVAA